MEMQIPSPIKPLFTLETDDKVKYRSYQNELALFVMQDQLLNAHLWERFVAQFSEQIDGSNMGWRGEYFGKMLRGGCLTYRYTGSCALYRVLAHAVEAMLAVQEEDGRISSYARDCEFDAWDLWCRKYVMLGMEYFLEICHSSKLKKRVLRCIMRQADAIMRSVGPEEGKKNILTCTRHWGGLNSCSILEPFVRLYALTGERSYLCFAEYIISTGFCADGNLIDLVNEGRAPYTFPQVKAYEMMSCFEGLIEYALLMGRRDYLDTAVKFAHSIAETDVTAIGSCGCTHELFDNSAEKQTEYSEGIMQETCVTVTWMKLCFRLLTVTGDARFADYIEKSALNALSSAVNDFGNKKDGGLTFDSYAPLVASRHCKAVGGKQTISPDGEFYGCCACIGSAGTAIANLYGFLRSENGIVINQYQPARISFVTPGGQNATLQIISHMPKSGQVRIKLGLEKEETFTLSLRIPSWSRKTEVRVGNRGRIRGEGGTYLTQSFCFHDGDEIRLLLDCAARAEERNGKLCISRCGYVFARDERLGADYKDPIDLRLGAKGKVSMHAGKPTVKANMQADLLLSDGTSVPMVDYASAGKAWDEDACGVNVWMALK